MQAQVGRSGSFQYLPVELFKIGRKFFAFDAGSVLFMEVDRITHDILQLLRNRKFSPKELTARLAGHAPAEVRQACRELEDLHRRGYLRPRTLRRKPPCTLDEVGRSLSLELPGLTIFLTTRCNLACSYCIYGAARRRQDFPADESMTWPTAKNTLEFLDRHSSGAGRIKIEFFGGEPLLAFPILQKCVAYWRTIAPSKAERTDLVVITNGTLLRGERLDFLVRNRIHAQISLDGDSVSHDAARRYRGSGRGSFADVFSNLVALHERDPEYLAGYVHLKGVVTCENLEVDDGAFYNRPVIKTLERAGNLHRIVERPRQDLEKDSDFLRCLRKVGDKLLRVRGARSIPDLLSALNERERFFYEWTFADFYNIQALNRVFSRGGEAPFLKSCRMGCGYNAVLPSGDIAVCADATSHVIGNVNQGRWHLDRISEMHRRLYQNWPDCSGCFAGRFCRLCWQKVPGDGETWRCGRMRFCTFTREYYRAVFGCMLRVLAQNPRIWDAMAQAVRERIREVCAEQLISSAHPS